MTTSCMPACSNASATLAQRSEPKRSSAPLTIALPGPKLTEVLFRLEVIENKEHELVPADKLKSACRDLKRNPLRGKPLTGPLAGCYRIHVGGSETRLVYTYSHDRDEITVLIIGRRRESEVYAAAEKRR